MALPLPDPPFIEARWYSKANRRPGDVLWITLHDMEAPEKGDTAEAVARYFQRLPSSNKASAHRLFDSDSEVLAVRLDDHAYHAGRTANVYGLGYEHAGFARQQRHEWLDDYGRAMLARSAARAAADCVAWGIPVQFVRAADLKNRRPGITTHYEISTAFGETHHTDPGPGFPIDYYLDLVRANMLPATGSPAPAAPTGGSAPVTINRPPVAILAHPAGGYYEVSDEGGVFAFDAPAFENPIPGIHLNAPIVGGAVRAQGDGLWLVGADGGVFGLGNAPSYGSMGGRPMNAPVVGMAATSSGHGYWLVGRDGGVFAFGDATFRGSVSYAGG